MKREKSLFFRHYKRLARGVAAQVARELYGGDRSRARDRLLAGDERAWALARERNAAEVARIKRALSLASKA